MLCCKDGNDQEKVLRTSVVNSTKQVWRHKYAALLIGMVCCSQSYASTHHMVESGETLSGIAERYGVSQTALIDVNGLTASMIKVGQVIDIPEKGAYHNIYKVRVGDNLKYLAKRYQVDINELARVNKLTPESGLLIDSTLIIPSSKSSTVSNTIKEAKTTTKIQASNVQSKPVKKIVPPAATVSRRNDVLHQIKYGETLSDIAGQHKVDVQSLARANNMDINDTVYFGKYLIVPTTVKANMQRVVSNNSNAAKSVARPSTYIVQRGNTLMGIANKYNADFMEIAKLTGISPYDELAIGQQLTLPSKAY